MKKGFNNTGNPAKIRQLNRRAILNYLRAGMPTSRSEVVRVLGLAPATVSAIVGDLVNEGLVIETGLLYVDKRRPGRPSHEIKLNPDAAYVIGIVMRIEFDTLYLDVSSSDYSGSLNIKHTAKVSDKESLKSIIDCITTVLDNICVPPLSRKNTVSLCIGIPGVIDQDSNAIVFCQNIPRILGSDFHQQLSKCVWMPVHFENDVNLAVISQLNSKPELNNINFSYLFISQGVGAGTSLQGSLWKSSGWAGEIGQLDVPFKEETKKLEWILGMSQYVSEFEKDVKMSLHQAFACLNTSPSELDAQNKTKIMAMMSTYTDYLYMAIQVLNASFDLNEVIIGESHESAVQFCLPELQQKIKTSHLHVNVSLSVNAGQSSVKGAALLALQHSLDELELVT